MVLLGQMVVLFVIMLVGLACRKYGIFNDTVVKHISSLVVNVANPCMIIAAAINPEGNVSGQALIITALLSIVMYIGLIVFAQFVPGILKAPKADYGIYRALTVFANIGFMGFPLIKSVYGSEALLFAAIFQLPFNLLVYTYGVYVICKSSNDSDNGDENAKDNPLKKMLNIGVFGCLIAIALFLIRPAVPYVIENIFDYIGDMTPPLSMMIIGDSLSKMNFKKLFANKQLIGYSIIKLLFIPIAGTYLAMLCGISGTLLGVFMIMLATPAATMNVLLAQEYDSNYQVASEGVAITTLLSIATIPLVSLILGL